MKAVRKMSRNPWDLGMGEQDEPQVQNNEVKIKLAFNGICGSDSHILEEDAGGIVPKPSPLTLGHEFSGIVTEVGDGVTEFAIGDRVTAQPGSNFCTDCTDVLRGGLYACKNKRSLGYENQGSMTEYLCINKALVYKLPDNVTMEEGALVEPACVAAHAVFDHVNILPSDNVVVIGDGPIGLLVCAFLKARGATVILLGREASKNRLALGKKMGADYTFMTDKDNIVEEVNKITNGLRADCVFECVGLDATISLGVALTKKRGTMVQVGVMLQSGTHISSMLFGVMTEVRIQNCFGHTYLNWLQVIKMMGDKKIDVTPLISHKFPYEEYQKAFDATFKTGEGVKVLLYP